MFASLGEECFMGCYLFFFFNDTATTEIYTLSLHDALPIRACTWSSTSLRRGTSRCSCWARSEEHTSELQSHVNLVCRLLLEKKKEARPGLIHILFKDLTGTECHNPPRSDADLFNGSVIAAFSRPFTLDDNFSYNDTSTSEIYTLPLHDALPI